MSDSKLKKTTWLPKNRIKLSNIMYPILPNLSIKNPKNGVIIAEIKNIADKYWPAKVAGMLYIFPKKSLAFEVKVKKAP